MQSKNVPQTLLWILRIVVGVLFILSGFSKIIDPHGLEYKMVEFFEVLHWDFLTPYALPFAVAMNFFEVVAGVALLIGYRFKLFSILTLLLILFFTFLTGYALYSGKIKECGCFGNCIKLKAHETFYKDIILTVLILILVFYRKYIKDFYSKSVGTVIILVFAFWALYMQVWALKHGAIIDCLPYKAGNNIMEKKTIGPDYQAAVTEIIYQYKNAKSGEVKKMDEKTFMASKIWEDTLNWVAMETIQNEISPAKNLPEILDFDIIDFNGATITDSILNYEGYSFLFIAKDLSEANTSNMAALQKLLADAKAKGIPVLGVSSSDDIAANEFNEKNKIQMNFAQIDGTVAKTAMRTNPGIFLLKKGTIIGKWSYADYPNLEKMFGK